MELRAEQEKKLREFMAVFLEENRKLNLSAYRTEGACWVGNVLDSVAAIEVVRGCCLRGEGTHLRQGFDGRAGWGTGTRQKCRVIEVGMGGGFPLLPLALLLPDMEFTGLDATKKKVDAVQRIVNVLGMTNVHLLVGRAEELGHPAPVVRPSSPRYGAHDPNLREQFDVVLGRAVAELPTLLEFLSPFARVGGKILCWKSLAIEEELQASVTARMQLQCRLVDRHEYELPEGWGRRQILIFEKTKTLPQEFPRKTGVPKKEPL